VLYSAYMHRKLPSAGKTGQ